MAMRKLPRPHDPPPPSDGRSLRRSALVIVLGLALSPIVYESSAQCAAGWAAMYGSVRQVDTPVLDRLGRCMDALAGAAHETGERAFHALPWKPALVIPIALAWAALGALILRGR
jgi:hypothetical protein